MWMCRWPWGTPRRPQCCSSGSSFCWCRTWVPSPRTCTSPWSSTITMTVRRIPINASNDQNENRFQMMMKVNTTAAVPSKSPRLSTNHLASRRVNVTACSLRARLCTWRWVRWRRPSTHCEWVCQQSKAGWRSFRKETDTGRPSMSLRETLQIRWWVRYVQEQDWLSCILHLKYSHFTL